jgi:hypothetical protein
MSKKKPVMVNLKETKTGVKVEVRPPGKTPYELKDGKGKNPRRYFDKSTAKRGARRHLKAYKSMDGSWYTSMYKGRSGGWRMVVFQIVTKR